MNARVSDDDGHVDAGDECFLRSAHGLLSLGLSPRSPQSRALGTYFSNNEHQAPTYIAVFGEYCIHNS